MAEQNPLEKSLQLLWEGLPEPEKGPKPKLTLEQIVAAGIELADNEGVEALSMRKLAQQLDVGTMSLYRYVPSKDDLLNLMLDAAVTPSERRMAAPDQGWREFLRVAAYDARQMYMRHPWILQTNWSRPVIGPNSMRDLDLFLTGTKSLPMTDQERMNLASVFDAFVLGCARQELLWVNAAAESEMTDEEFWTYQLPWLTGAMESGNYPAMAELADDTFDGGWEETFELGLQLFLDGIQRRVSQIQDE